MAINSRDVIRALRSAGWEHVATSGSHWQFKHPERPGRVTVPHPRHDLPPGAVASIERQAGISIRRLQ